MQSINGVTTNQSRSDTGSFESPVISQNESSDLIDIADELSSENLALTPKSNGHLP